MPLLKNWTVVSPSGKPCAELSEAKRSSDILVLRAWGFTENSGDHCHWDEHLFIMFGKRISHLIDPFPRIFIYYLSFFTLELTLCVWVRNWVNSLCLGRRTKLSCIFSSSSNLPFENLLGFHLTELHSSAFEREDVSECVSSESWAGVGGLVSQPLV